MNVRWFVLALAASFSSQLASVAADNSPSSVATSQQSAPSIHFLRPIRGERFFDFPIFLQVSVSGFHLMPPNNQHGKTVPTDSGYIRYSVDDYPVYGTNETQIMFGKFLGTHYIPVGWHSVKAELVNMDGNSLNPPVIAETSALSGHTAAVETDHVQNGSVQAENNAQELYKMRLQIQELQKELVKIRTGNSGFVPVPMNEGEHRGE